MNVFSAIFFIALLFSLSFGAGERCGTRHFIKNFKKTPEKILAKEYSAASSYAVQNKRTPHFIIYYTTEGTHAVRTLAYIDSLAKYLEQAYSLHTNTLGMKSISGTSTAHFYSQRVPTGLYPVEVIDTGLGDGEYMKNCAAYGLTFPHDPGAPGRTQIAIENNFIFDVDCEIDYGVIRKGTHFTSSVNDYSRDGKWHLALKATVFHELYHSFQMTQFDIFRYNTFWLEASATGVEEIGAPEVDDYIDYIPSIFKNPGESMQDLDRTSIESYGYATLYLFLSSEFGRKFDSYIWDYFSKSPKESFLIQLARYISLHGKEDEDAEFIFHKYATHIFYSGSRAAASPFNLFWEDMPNWPSWSMNENIPSYLPVGTFDFIRIPDGTITSQPDSVTGDSKLLFGKNNDSTVWVLSRLLAKDFAPPILPPSPSDSIDTVPPLKQFAAYPNPWNPKRSEKVKFGPLPNSGGVEIRTANGALLQRIDGKTGDTLTWQPEKLPAPGVLYYRTLPYGKNKMLLLER